MVEMVKSYNRNGPSNNDGKIGWKIVFFKRKIDWSPTTKKCQKKDGNDGKSCFPLWENWLKKIVFFKQILKKNKSLQFFLKPIRWARSWTQWPSRSTSRQRWQRMEPNGWNPTDGISERWPKKCKKSLFLFKKRLNENTHFFWKNTFLKPFSG